METIENESQIGNLTDNKIIGNPNLNNSKIIFNGRNNIFVCDNINLINAVIDFKGDNSLVYIRSDLGNLFRLSIYNNSAVYIGKDSKIGTSINLDAQEGQNIIIGDDCIIGNKVNIMTSDIFPMYDVNTKERVNFSRSIFIGDYVWVNHLTYIARGVQIGSGTFVDYNSAIPSNTRLPSNCYLSGNPVRIFKKDIFYTKHFIGNNRANETLDSKYYKSDVFIYDYIPNETLDLNRIDQILKDLTVDEKFEFIKKLFVSNKRKNRFTIK